MKTKFFLLITLFFCSLHLFSQIPKQPVVAKPVTKVPVAQKISAHVPDANLVHLQKVVVNIVVGDDGKDKDSKLSIAVYITAKNPFTGKDQDDQCAYYGNGGGPISSDAYLPVKV